LPLGVSPAGGGMNPQKKLKIFGGESFNFSFFLISVHLAEKTKDGEVYLYSETKGVMCQDQSLKFWWQGGGVVS
jgi:hypothetical protein